MDINLPLILLIAVAITGAAWFYDLLVLKPKRKVALAALDAQFDGVDAQTKEDNAGYREGYLQIFQEKQPFEFARSIFPVLFLVFFLRSFIVEPFQIPSESMVPTLEVGDFILVNKFIYGVRLPVARTKVIPITSPDRGDVMVFFPPNETRYFIKRVIGLPGDEIRIKENVLYINGEEAKQEALKTDDEQRLNSCTVNGGRMVVGVERFSEGNEHQLRRCKKTGKYANDGYWVVPEGHYFMMGDNRDNSLDSRAWGPVPEDRIVGQAFAIWMHWESMMSIPSFSRVGGI